MILIDVSEHQRTKDAFKERLGDNCNIKELGCWDCLNHNILLQHRHKLYCTETIDVPILLENGFFLAKDKSKCSTCEHRKYVRFADFEIADNRAFYERKTVADFLSSMRERLYHQLTTMDTFIEGRKGLILEGMPRDIVRVQDSKNQYSGITKIRHDLRGKSPLEQAVIMAGGEGKANWIYSFIRECKMHDMEFVQTVDLQETITFLEMCDEGYDETPKLRVIPKRYQDISLEQNILVLIPKIGRVNSESLLKKHKTLPQLIYDVSKMKERNSIYEEIWKVFCNG